MMKLYGARHTQTNYNVQHLCNSDPTVDVHLTELGKAQAKQLAEKLSDIAFDILYLSELPRTRETASYLSQFSTVPIIVDGRLNDNASGFESRPDTEYLAAFNAHPDKWHAVFNDGESMAHAKQRVASFLDEMKTKDYGIVLIITHGYIVECINAIINDFDFEVASTFDVPQGEYRVYSL